MPKFNAKNASVKQKFSIADLKKTVEVLEHFRPYVDMLETRWEFSNPQVTHQYLVDTVKGSIDFLNDYYK